MKEFAKLLMDLESNIKTIGPVTAALTCLLIESQSTIFMSCWDFSKRQGEI